MEPEKCRHFWEYKNVEFDKSEKFFAIIINTTLYIYTVITIIWIQSTFREIF